MGQPAPARTRRSCTSGKRSEDVVNRSSGKSDGPPHVKLDANRYTDAAASAQRQRNRGDQHPGIEAILQLVFMRFRQQERGTSQNCMALSNNRSFPSWNRSPSSCEKHYVVNEDVPVWSAVVSRHS